MPRHRPAKKLIIYITAADRHGGVPLYHRLLELLLEHGCAGATVTRGIAGFGPRGAVRRLTSLSLRRDVPVRIEVVERAEAIRRLLPSVYALVGDGLIEVLDTTVVKWPHEGRPRASGAPSPPD